MADQDDSPGKIKPTNKISKPIGTVKKEITKAGVAKLISQSKLMPSALQPPAGPPEPPRLQPCINVDIAARKIKTPGKVPAMKNPALIAFFDMSSLNAYVDRRRMPPVSNNEL